MERYKGKSVFPKIVIGTIWFYEKEQTKIPKLWAEDTDAQLERFSAARAAAAEELVQLEKTAQKTAGEKNAEVFAVHRMLLEDPDYVSRIRDTVKREHVNLEYAIWKSTEEIVQMFAMMDDTYMRARAADIRDISDRLLRILSGRPEREAAPKVPSVVAAEDLAPSDTVQFDASLVLAFLTEKGSVNSHTAILSRMMGVPALLGIPVSRQWNGRTAIVDGIAGEVILDPEPEQLLAAQEVIRREEEKADRLQKLIGKETVTRGGRKIHLYANAGSLADVEAAALNDAEGIGLFRSEVLYLEKDCYPTQEEQYQTYLFLAERMKGRPVVIRTLDIGADKRADYFDLPPEENPELGFRAIRLCLSRPEMFLDQLKAILRAGVCGNVRLLIPMIVSLEEIRTVRQLIRQAGEELEAEGIPYAMVPLGVMIETPAAVMIAEELAQEVDFFSIGTNDLTQYTLAADRQNPSLDRVFNPKHPAVLRMLRMTAECAGRHQIPVSICGELAADTEMTELFVRMGIDTLSVSPAMVLPVRKRVMDLEI